MYVQLILVLGIILLAVAHFRKDTAEGQQLKRIGWRMIAVALLIPATLILIMMVLRFLDIHAPH